MAKPEVHAAVPVTDDRPRRMTLSDVLERLLARGAGEHSSVTLSRNSKGETQIEVTVRTGENEDVQTVEQAMSKARATYDDLTARYPTGSGSVRNDG